MEIGNFYEYSGIKVKLEMISECSTQCDWCGAVTQKKYILRNKKKGFVIGICESCTKDMIPYKRVQIIIYPDSQSEINDIRILADKEKMSITAYILHLIRKELKKEGESNAKS